MEAEITVGIETRYVPDGPAIKFRCRRDFPRPSRSAPRSTKPPVQRVKRPALGTDQSLVPVTEL